MNLYEGIKNNLIESTITKDDLTADVKRDLNIEPGSDEEYELDNLYALRDLDVWIEDLYDDGDSREDIKNKFAIEDIALHYGMSEEDLDAKVDEVCTKVDKLGDEHEKFMQFLRSKNSLDESEDIYGFASKSNVTDFTYDEIRNRDKSIYEAEGRPSIPMDVKELVENIIYDDRNLDLRTAQFEGSNFVVEPRTNLDEALFDKIVQRISDQFNTYGISYDSIEDVDNNVVVYDCYMSDEAYKEYKDNSDDYKQEDEEFYMLNKDTDEKVRVYKDGNRWYDSDGNRYMGYLSKEDVKAYFKGNWEELNESEDNSTEVIKNVIKSKNLPNGTKVSSITDDTFNSIVKDVQSKMPNSDEKEVRNKVAGTLFSMFEESDSGLKEGKTNCTDNFNEAEVAEDATEKYWDATTIQQDQFLRLMKFNFTEPHGCQYIITNDANEIERFSANSDEEALEQYNLFKEGLDSGLIELIPQDLNVKPIVPREDFNETELSDRKFCDLPDDFQKKVINYLLKKKRGTADEIIKYLMHAKIGDFNDTSLLTQDEFVDLYKV